MKISCIFVLSNDTNNMFSYNFIAYLIYLSLTSFITIRVGWLCYKNGAAYIYELIGKTAVADGLNKLLLVGYYLLNLGYLATSILEWNEISSLMEMVNMLSIKIGGIVLILGLLHFFNMYIIARFGKRLLSA